MKAILCETLDGIDLIRRSADVPEPVACQTAEDAVLALLPHCGDRFLRYLRADYLPEALTLRAGLPPATPLVLSAVDTDAQEGE
jgi:hypothetical protein